MIYIEETGTNYSGGIALQNNERLFGEGHTGAANLSGVLKLLKLNAHARDFFYCHAPHREKETADTWPL